MNEAPYDAWLIQVENITEKQELMTAEEYIRFYESEKSSMGSFLPNSRQEQQRMLKETGYENFDALFSQIPEAVRVKELHLPGGMSELEASAWMEETGRKTGCFSIYSGARALTAIIFLPL